MKHSTLIFALCLAFLTGSIYAQKTTDAVKFSSRYTNLDKDCKTLKGGSEGTDDASNCRGVGGYRIYVGAAAAAQTISIQSPKNDNVGSIPMQNFDWNQTKIKVEWRLADGKPFALIMRVFKYDGEGTESYDYFGKKIGEELIVVGLEGFENIDFTIDAKTPDANLKARELADNGFRQKMQN